ncbi:ATP-binding protein [Actinomadura violacea]|uniref:Tetratricopeptide repeat protein n=1 Tax=Actinomadura violacea TaxID=2819934 RepID=A0ABS3S5L3_9ACTN|nr:BTAD domain-containing putative transcriptional regulator [Actinomadura violacea]MBO2464252.1 tetratricopeptide repeat protein [Actinomadura violacea]
MRFGILGETRAWRDGGEDVPLGGPARRALLALLLVRPGAAVPADRLAAGGTAGHALHSQVSRLRAALGPDAAIERDGGGYRIAVGPDDVDAGRFERLADEGRAALRDGAADRAAELLGEALSLWRGPALADVPWAETDALRLEERRTAATEDRIEADLLRGRHRDVVPELRDLLGRHPLRERLAGLLMRALRDGGGQAEALLVFEETRRRLAGELGADPSADLAALHRDLLRGDPAPAPVRPPAPLTDLVGRGGDVDGVADLLASARLVTLTGPGGVGKTRLAVEVAGRADGEACFAELAPLRDGASLPRALLGALGLRESGLQAPDAGKGPEDRLAAALADRPLLLVLDNCEQVVDAVAALAGRLLAACPGLRVLATSREPLGITGENLWPVRPLDGDAAVRLFTARASAVRRGFAADPAVVRRICAALDDLPLAIELAAARLRTMDVADLAGRLDDRLGVPSRGSRTADERHRTLRAVVAWSWDLLDEDERRVAERFTAFAGGAAPDAARRVCGDGGDALESLVDKSLLELAGGRYRMLETIRAYGAERAAESGADARDAHAAYFLELAQTADPQLRTGAQLDWLGVLAAEHGNLLAALGGAAEARDVPAGLRLAAAMSSYLWIRGVAVAAQAAALLDVAGPVPPPGLEEEYAACVLHAGADAAGREVWQRHRAAAEAALEAAWADGKAGRHPAVPFLWMMRRADEPDAQSAFALVLAQRDGPDPWARAAARFIAGFEPLAAGDMEGAAAEFGAAAGGFRALGDRWGTALALDALAGLAAHRGDRAAAVALTDEALALTERLGALDETADLLVNRGDHRVEDDRDSARADYERAAAVARRAGSPTYLAGALRGLGDIALLDGDPGTAERLYTDALARFDPHWIKSVGGRASALVGLGRVAAARGDGGTARSRYREAAGAAASKGAFMEAARAVDVLAGLEAAQGDADRAARLSAAAQALRGAPATALSRADALRLAGLDEQVIEAVSRR